jgi:hypothetical protein
MCNLVLDYLHSKTNKSKKKREKREREKKENQRNQQGEVVDKQTENKTNGHLKEKKFQVQEQ